MEQKIHAFFEKVAESLFTLPPIMIGMFAMYGYLVYESQALLITQLPDSLSGEQRQIAAWFLSVAIHLTILTTAANSQLVHQAFPLLFALAGYFITTLFFDAWNFAKPKQDLFVSQLFSLLIAVINYLFVYLFVGKWKELKGEQSLQQALHQARTRVALLEEAVSTADRSLTKLEQQLEGRNQELSKVHQQLSTLQQALTHQQQQHQKELQLVDQHRMCVGCGYQARTYQQLSRYKRDCQQCQQQRKKQANHSAV